MGPTTTRKTNTIHQFQNNFHFLRRFEKGYGQDGLFSMLGRREGEVPDIEICCQFNLGHKTMTINFVVFINRSMHRACCFYRKKLMPSLKVQLHAAQRELNASLTWGTSLALNAKSTRWAFKSRVECFKYALNVWAVYVRPLNFKFDV